MDIKKVGVVGCGLMGSGIVQVLAQAGYDVVVREVNDEFLAGGIRKVDKALGKAVEKGKLTAEQKQAIVGRVAGTTRVEDLKECDLIIEAIVENVAAKQDLWTALDRICPANVIFASNTSSIPIRIQSGVTGRPDRFIGLHFFNPVPVMKLVEVIRSDATSEATYQAAMGLCRKLDKEPVTCQDSVGFIVNRLLVPYLFDAVRALEAGIASKEDIDTGMRLGCSYPMGPLTLSDFVGLDTLAAIGDVMYQEFKLPQYDVPPLLRRLVADKKCGRKSGEGFYQY